MWIRTFTLVIAVSILLFVAAPISRADTLTLNDGSTTEGVIKKVVAGKVVVEVGNEEKVFEILDIKSMDFNTPHLLAGADKLPVDHFMKDVEAQELVKNIEQLQKAEADIKMKLDQIRMYWAHVQPIDSAQLPGWDAAKEEFRKPLERYQELLNDMYFHMLVQVDKYNALAKEAREVYVGVKGIKIGSALIAKDVLKLPLRKYVPATWYDTIYYEGYYRGFDEAYQKFAAPKSN